MTRPSKNPGQAMPLAGWGKTRPRGWGGHIVFLRNRHIFQSFSQSVLETWPSGHTLHGSSPCSTLNVPAPQAATLLPAPVNPALATQSVRASEEVTRQLSDQVLAGQWRQFSAPVAGLHLPWGQTRHVPPPLPNLPEPQRLGPVPMQVTPTDSFWLFWSRMPEPLLISLREKSRIPWVTPKLPKPPAERHCRGSIHKPCVWICATQNLLEYGEPALGIKAGEQVLQQQPFPVAGSTPFRSISSHLGSQTASVISVTHKR